MKFGRKLIALSLMLVMIVNFSLLGVIQAVAHDSILNVKYDACEDLEDVDGIDEKWYALVNLESECYHISHETQIIKYYFADESPSGYRWDDDISEELAEEIKSCYANSMEKWNNVYFYSYDSADISATAPVPAEMLLWAKTPRMKKSNTITCLLLWAGFAIFVNIYYQNKAFWRTI